MALYTGGARTATARARAGSEIFLLSQERWERLRADHPEIAERFHVHIVRLLAGRLDRSNTRLFRALS